MISISWFWYHEKILFLAKIIAGQRSALMYSCIARSIFNHALKIEPKNLLLQFLNNHPESFRICSRDHLEETNRAEF